MFLSILSIINFVFKSSIFYVNFLKKISNFSINLLIINSWFYAYILFLKYNSFFFKSYLIDINAFDLNKKFLLHFKKIKLNCIVYYFFLSKINFKLNFFTFTSELNKINSISNLFNNSKWVEREISEMFGIFFLNKIDSRNLLLDYSYIGYPLLKLFPITGNIEIYFNFLNNWISYTKIILKESNKTEFYFY